MKKLVEIPVLKGRVTWRSDGTSVRHVIALLEAARVVDSAARVTLTQDGLSVWIDV